MFFYNFIIFSCRISCFLEVFIYNFPTRKDLSVKPMTGQKKKLLQDIADRNGVSIATVYRILHGTGSLKNPSYQAIYNELQELDKIQNGIPKYPIMLVTENSLSSHALQFYDALKTLCSRRRIEMVLTLKKTLEHDLALRSFSGIIALTTVSVPEKIPLVYLTCRSAAGKESSVCTDIILNWLAMLNHLKEHGAKRIGLFHGFPPHDPHFYLAAGNFPGELLLKTAGVPFESELVCPVILSPGTHASGMEEAVDYFCQLPKLPDTLLVNFDFYIPKMISEFQKRGISVPEDLLIAAVYSFMQAPSSTSYPTTYSLSEEYHDLQSMPCICGIHYFHEMATNALELLLEKIRNPTAIARQICYSLKIQDYRFMATSNKT